MPYPEIYGISPYLGILFGTNYSISKMVTQTPAIVSLFASYCIPLRSTKSLLISKFV